MGSTTENVKLGVCSVLFDGVNLGFTKGGVEVEVATSTKEVKVDQLGETPIGELVTGRTVTATVPLAETTLENLVQIMPGSVLETDGIKATGTVTMTAAPVAGDSVTISGTKFTFVVKPAAVGDVKIGADEVASAAALADAIRASDVGYVATADAGVVTITSKATGAAWNAVMTATFATPGNVVVTSIANGVDATFARVEVTTGVNINLLSVAKELVLRPRGTFGEDDFTILNAATAGALNFSYSTDNERVYNAKFSGYPNSNGKLFSVGK